MQNTIVNNIVYDEINSCHHSGFLAKYRNTTLAIKMIYKGICIFQNSDIDIKYTPTHFLSTENFHHSYHHLDVCNLSFPYIYMFWFWILQHNSIQPKIYIRNVHCIFYAKYRYLFDGSLEVRS